MKQPQLYKNFNYKLRKEHTEDVRRSKHQRSSKQVQ